MEEPVKFIIQLMSIMPSYPQYLHVQVCDECYALVPVAKIDIHAQLAHGAS